MKPEIRAGMVKDFFALLRGGKVPEGAEILARADPLFTVLLETASRLDWLPAEPVVSLADFGRSRMGSSRWRALHRDAAGELTERPLFRAVAQGIGSVFGATPAAYCRIFPVVFKQAHRNFGSIEYASTGKNEAQLAFAASPTEALSHGMLDVFAGTLEGLVTPMARHVTLRVDYDPGADHALITLRWDG